MNVELKTGIILYPEIEEKVLAITASMGMEDRVIYSSFCHPSLVRLKELDSGLKTGLLYSDGWIGAADYGRRTVGADALHPALYHMQDPQLIPAARRQGLAVNVWTVNEEPHMEMLVQQKVDAIITNRPDLCRGIVDRFTEL